MLPNAVHFNSHLKDMGLEWCWPFCENYLSVYSCWNFLVAFLCIAHQTRDISLFINLAFDCFTFKSPKVYWFCCSHWTAYSWCVLWKWPQNTCSSDTICPELPCWLWWGSRNKSFLISVGMWEYCMPSNAPSLNHCVCALKQILCILLCLYSPFWDVLLIHSHKCQAHTTITLTVPS